jgi:hypothetical protein
LTPYFQCLLGNCAWAHSRLPVCFAKSVLYNLHRLSYETSCEAVDLAKRLCYLMHTNCFRLTLSRSFNKAREVHPLLRAREHLEGHCVPKCSWHHRKVVMCARIPLNCTAITLSKVYTTSLHVATFKNCISLVIAITGVKSLQ